MTSSASTIAEFLDATAARKPTPGGGAVAALAGALSAAIGEMTINYSIGKKGLEAHQEQLQSALAELTRARGVMSELIVEDQSAYAALTAARKLAPETPDRERTIAESLVMSIRAPQAIGATAVAILGICDDVVGSINQYLLSDLAVAADLAMATARCATYNVRVNLPDVKSDGERKAIEIATGKILAHALASIQRVSPRIWERFVQGC